MTPLAYRLVKNWLLPEGKRDPFIVDRAELFKDGWLDDIHCFECTEVFELAKDLTKDWSDKHVTISDIPAATFLPAPRTWIEYTSTTDDARTNRFGFLLCDITDIVGEKYMMVHSVISMYDENIRGYGVIVLPYIFSYPLGQEIDPFSSDDAKLTGIKYRNLDEGLSEEETKELNYIADHEELKAWCFGFHIEMYAMMSIINTPRLVERTSHHPHRTLERKIRNSSRRVRLNNWTEIKLSITPPMIEGETHEMRLTGKKALHFCRSHIRIKRGKLEIVRAHFRGDPTIGIKQSRYKITA